MNKTRFAALPLLFTLIACGVNFKPLQKEANTFAFTTEAQLEDASITQTIDAFYTSGNEGYFNGKNEVKIFYKTFIQPNKKSEAIFISSGRTEAAIKYKEVVYDLYKNGYSIYIHDHRGQGQSGRMTEDPDMGYIDTFQFYIDDMKLFFEMERLKRVHPKYYLLAHSMGGAIGMTYLEQFPEDFDAAAFSSPMLGFVTGTCSATKVLMGKKPKYAAGQSVYRDDKLNFETNTLTGSKVRYDRMNAAFKEVPEARLGGASYQWVHRCCLHYTYLNSHIDQIQTPFILFSAENEKIVNPKAHEHFVKQAQELGKTCEAYTIENAMHELLIEKDEQRIETMNHVLTFFSRY